MARRSRTSLVIATTGAILLGSCNWLTGAADLRVVEPTSDGGNAALGGDAGGPAGGASSGGSGGTSSGGVSGGGEGGRVPIDCEDNPDCVHPDACLLGTCDGADGTCTFKQKSCASPRVCEGGECVCPPGQVDCGGACLEGACCEGQTNGPCERCGTLTCKDDRTGFECMGQKTCEPTNTCTTACCAVLYGATCTSACEWGPCTLLGG